MTGVVLAQPPGLTAGNPPPEPAHRVVLIDSRHERRAIASLLIDRSAALTVVGQAGSLEDAEALIRVERADVAVIEIQMPLADGMATIEALRQRFPTLCIVVCSFLSDSATRDAASAHGADGYLAKPLDVGELVMLVSLRDGSRLAARTDPAPDPAA